MSPSVSKVQRRFFAVALKSPGKLRGKKPKMSKKSMKHFAGTKETGLPYRKRRKSIGSMRRRKY